MQQKQVSVIEKEWIREYLLEEDPSYLHLLHSSCLTPPLSQAPRALTEAACEDCDWRLRAPCASSPPACSRRSDGACTHSWMTPARITSLLKRPSSLSSGSLSSTITCTLYPDWKNSVFVCATEGHTTAITSSLDDTSGVAERERERWEGGDLGGGVVKKEKRLSSRDGVAAAAAIEDPKGVRCVDEG